MPDFFALPKKDAELALAVQLLDKSSSLDIDILDSLVGHPQRYADLQKLLKGRNDNTLNRALTQLRGDGLVQQRLDVRKHAKLYSLTALGKLVLYRMQQMRPHHESIEAYERGHALHAA